MNRSDSLASLKAELEKIKEECARLAGKISSLESVTSAGQDIQEQELPSAPVVPPPAFEKPLPPKPGKTDIEMDLGKFWLNKIGVIIFALGIAFLITYTFKYFGPLLKIIFGYLVGGALFFWGGRLEKKEAFVNYGRVLLGGAWAIVYFTTYAMQHFAASRIIYSELVDLLLLACVSLGILSHALRYQSQELAACALAVGYITSTLGDVSYFTLASTGLLSVITIALVYKFAWTKLVWYGIVFAYCAHSFWTIKHIVLSPVHLGILDVKRAYFLFNAGFLALYWLLFTVAIHCSKDTKDASVHDKLAAANFTNFLLFFVMLYPKFAIFYPLQKSTLVLGLGIGYLALAGIMEERKIARLFTSNIIIAVSLLSLAVPLKMAAWHTSVIWMVELPFLALVGFIFNRPVFRYLGIALACVLLVKFLAVDMYIESPCGPWLGGIIWSKFLSLLGFFSAASCYLLYRRFKDAYPARGAEDLVHNFYPIVASIYLSVALWQWVNPPLRSLAFFLEGLCILCFGYLYKDACLRAISLAVLLVAGTRFCFIDEYSAYTAWRKWFLVSSQILCVYAAYLLYRRLAQKAARYSIEKPVAGCLFFAATWLTVYAIFRYSQEAWISVALGMAGVFLFAGGFFLKEKIIRVGGFMLFAITLARVVLVDMSALPIVYKIISFILLGGLFLGVSFIYTRFASLKTEEKP